MIRQLEDSTYLDDAVELAPAAARSSRAAYLVTGVAVTALIAVYLFAAKDLNWIAHDEGLLGHTAERVLEGELPHRDFDDVYTGGLAMLHAAAFKVLGVKLTSLRWLLWGFSVLFVGATYAIASRFARPAGAALITLTAAAWGVPNYFAGLPSWYNLFFAVFGLLAVLRYLDTGRSRWLFAAGLCGGASLCIKIVGLYYLAAVGLFLVYHEQCRAEREGGDRSRGMFWLTLALAAAAVAMLALLVRRSFDLMVAINFLLPGVCLATILIVNEWRVGRGSFTVRLRRLAASIVPLAVGASVPVALFLIPYVRTDSLAALWRGVFVVPQLRLDFASFKLPHPVVVLFSIGAVALWCKLNPSRLKARHVALFALVGVPWLWLSAGGIALFSLWSSLRYALPLLAILACGLLLRRDVAVRPSMRRRQETFLLFAAAAYFLLLQYPYAAPIYFCYAAPLVVLAAACLARAWPGDPATLRWCWFALYMAFAVARLNTGAISTFGMSYAPPHVSTLLDLPRGGLMVSDGEAKGYAALVAEIQRRTPADSYIYAAPDAPHVYFLSDRKNPTRTMYDFFDDPTERTERLLKTLDEKRIAAVVVNANPDFSPPLPADLLEALKLRFPHEQTFGPMTLYTK